MSTPVWKKRFILIFGLLENLVFSGTILGWSAMNYILKSEGVYQYVCDEVKPQFQYKNLNFLNVSEDTDRRIKLKRNSGEQNDDQFLQKLKTLNQEFVDLLVKESVNNGKNMSLLEQLEAYQIETSFSLIYKHDGCAAQDKILNLIFTIGIFCMGLSSFVWGFLLDKWGLRIVRLVIGGFITGGSIFLCLTNSERPYLLFPAVTLLCLGGVPLRIANMQFANLYPKKRSTIISLYSGAFCASAVVFVALKYLYDMGLTYYSVTLLLVISSLSMFPFTLITLPADCIRDELDSCDSNDNESEW
ncbi:unnamed protein product [Oppiella nova]|uniref:Uncharacterized protein n=1 Tax=Oppiella nova TaxID=334625 RepID=A0A7R9M952_9ACAR|nr:unnamed protein product [Oppiella nova]CAG2172806.1 unnamed protein product [Oppiella nova]